MFRRSVPPRPLPAFQPLTHHQKKPKDTGCVEAVIALRVKDEEEPARLLRLSANTRWREQMDVVTQNSHSCVDGSQRRKSASIPHGQTEPEHLNHRTPSLILLSGRSPEPMRLLPIRTAHSGSNGGEEGQGGGAGRGGRGDRIVGFYFCFVAALLTHSPLKFNQAESVCSQASGCSAAPARRECGVFKERRQAGRQAQGILGELGAPALGLARFHSRSIAAAVASEGRKTIAPATGEKNTSRLCHKHKPDVAKAKGRCV